MQKQSNEINLNQVCNDLECGKVAYSAIDEKLKSKKECVISACKFNMINFVVAPVNFRRDKEIIDELFSISPKILLLLDRSTYLDVDYMKNKIEFLNKYYKEKVESSDPTEILNILQEQRDIIKKISSYYK